MEESNINFCKFVSRSFFRTLRKTGNFNQINPDFDFESTNGSLVATYEEGTLFRATFVYEEIQSSIRVRITRLLGFVEAKETFVSILRGELSENGIQLVE